MDVMGLNRLIFITNISCLLCLLVQVTVLLKAVTTTLAAWPHGPCAPDLDQPASCSPVDKGITSSNKRSGKQSPVNQIKGREGTQWAPALTGSGSEILTGEGGSTLQRRSRRSLQGHRDPAVGVGQLSPGQEIAWVDCRKSEGEVASAATVLGIGLSSEQRYASMQKCLLLALSITNLHHRRVSYVAVN